MEMFKNLTNEKVEKVVDKYFELNEDNIITSVIASNVQDSIVSEIDELVGELFAEKKLSPNDFTGWYKIPCSWDYETQEDYDKAVEQAELDQIAKQVYRWYSVNKKGFGLFRFCGDPVAEYKGIYIWGRTTNGESIVGDFTSDKRKMDLMRKLCKSNKSKN